MSGPTFDALPEPAPERVPPSVYFARIAMLVVLAAFATFWIWALFFASKEAVNKIDDRAWAARAQELCLAANAEREALADYTRIDVAPTAEMIAQRADIIDRSTDILAGMLDDIAARTPTDPKGQAIAPQWLADYRTFVQDRRDYADTLRDSRDNLPFYEHQIDGIPLSDKLEVFAGDNEMPACAPMRDLSN